MLSCSLLLCEDTGCSYAKLQLCKQCLVYKHWITRGTESVYFWRTGFKMVMFLISSSAIRVTHFLKNPILQNWASFYPCVSQEAKSGRGPEIIKIGSALVLLQQIPGPTLQWRTMWGSSNDLSAIYLLPLAFWVWACFDCIRTLLGCDDWTRVTAWLRRWIWLLESCYSACKHLLSQISPNTSIMRCCWE